MIGYVTLGTDDLQRAGRFYDSLLAELGAVRVMESERMILWAASGKPPALSANLPFDGERATFGNGTMVALDVGSRDAVDALYKKALQLGAKDEGAPGQRTNTFYAAYFRDPDGNKLNAYVFGAQAT